MVHVGGLLLFGQQGRFSYFGRTEISYLEFTEFVTLTWDQHKDLDRIVSATFVGFGLCGRMIWAANHQGLRFPCFSHQP